MKKLIIGEAIVVLSSLYFCVTEKNFGSTLLISALGLFIILIGYCEIVSKINKNEKTHHNIKAKKRKANRN